MTAAGEPGRVLLVEHGGRGGVADYTDALSRALAQAGCEVELVTATDHTYGAAPGRRVRRVIFYLRDRGPLSRVARRLRLSPPVNALAVVATLPVVWWRARRADVVHLQGAEWPPLLTLTALVARLARRPVVLTVHNTFERGRDYPRWNAASQRAAQALIVHTRADRDRLPARVRPRTHVIPHGEYTDLARRGGLAVEHPTEHRAALRVLLFGVLRPDKGIGDVLEAARETPGVEVVIAGEDHGGLAGVADLLADPALAGRVELHEGFIPDGEAAAHFAAADVAVLPYKLASASGVLLLAYGHRRPVVAYPTEGLVEYIVDGETGWLTDAPTPASLAATLAQVAALPAGERRRRGEAGHAFATAELGWTTIARRTLDLYAAIRPSS